MASSTFLAWAAAPRMKVFLLASPGVPGLSAGVYTNPSAARRSTATTTCLTCCNKCRRHNPKRKSVRKLTDYRIFLPIPISLAVGSLNQAWTPVWDGRGKTPGRHFSTTIGIITLCQYEAKTALDNTRSVYTPETGFMQD